MAKKLNHEEQIIKAEQKIAREKEKIQRLKEQQRRKATRMKIMYTDWIIKSLIERNNTLKHFTDYLTVKQKFSSPPEELMQWIKEMATEQNKKIQENIKKNPPQNKQIENTPTTEAEAPQPKQEPEPQAAQATPTPPVPQN